MVKKENETKKEKKPKRKSKPIGKESGLVVPILPFPSDFKHLESFCIETAKKLDQEMADIKRHIESEYTEDILSHLYNTNRALDRVLYVVIASMHKHLHTDDGFEEVEKIKQAVSSVSKKFRKHEPKLAYIDKSVESYVERENRGKTVYG